MGCVLLFSLMLCTIPSKKGIHSIYVTTAYLQWKDFFQRQCSWCKILFQIDIVTGTPGKLMDFISTGKLNLDQVRSLSRYLIHDLWSPLPSQYHASILVVMSKLFLCFKIALKFFSSSLDFSSLSGKLSIRLLCFKLLDLDILK